MKKNAPPAKPSVSRDLVTEELARSESVEASLMAGTSADGGLPLTPVESAILCMDKELIVGLQLIREIRNQAAMLETAFKLMTYELSVISKNLKNKE